ncbi:MAG: hypothetical protein ACI8WB_002416 [Phenylobacterium sp.]|jgi:hypothetical protein
MQDRYGERCARLHFFSHNFDHTKFSEIFEKEDAAKTISELKANYLGFIVIKPLPKTFIGKTCLKLYPELELASDKKVIRRTYSANLFGVELSVDSVAFQEQDKVLSACATTSIWSALHALDKSDSRSVPSSGEITLSAINHIVDSSNSFPNIGLTNKQILRALDIQKLRNHRVNIPEFDKNKKESSFRIIKSYIDSNIPVILGADVYRKDTEKLTYLAGHAVTILGYKEIDGKEALYLHDDRLGPFARAQFHCLQDLFPDISIVLEGKKKTDWCICLQEKSKEGKWLNVEQILIPDSLIIPNHTKVRIPSQYIDNTCDSIVGEFNAFWDQIAADNPDKQIKKGVLSYQIKLEKLADIKTRILKGKQVKDKLSILTQSAARFLWSAVFSLDGKESLEILFDSTDIPQGKAISSVIQYDIGRSDLILKCFYKLLAANEALPESDQDNFLTAFIYALKSKESGVAEYLNKRYGEPRAPKRLKAEEISHDKLQIQEDIPKRYGCEGKKLDDDFPMLNDDNTDYRLWAISADGALLIGAEIGEQGHPTLTGFKPARIAGELRKDKEGWFINAKSGRYSSDYSDANRLLANAREKFLEIYNNHKKGDLRIEEYHP